MSPFVEECLREWRRLGVPDPVANEMAADLAADLAEAEAEGASAEEVLGSGAFDARAFAAAWATERGVVPPPAHVGSAHRRRSRMPAVVAAFAIVAIIGVVLAIVASPSRTVPACPSGSVRPRTRRRGASAAFRQPANACRAAASEGRRAAAADRPALSRRTRPHRGRERLRAGTSGRSTCSCSSRGSSG